MTPLLPLEPKFAPHRDDLAVPEVNFDEPGAAHQLSVVVLQGRDLFSRLHIEDIRRVAPPKPAVEAKADAAMTEAHPPSAPEAAGAGSSSSPARRPQLLFRMTLPF